NRRVLQAEFAQDLSRRDAGLGEMAFHGLVGALRGFVFDQPQLNRLIPVRRDGLPLHDHTRAGFNHRDGRYAAVRRKDLSQPQLLTDNSVHHFNAPAPEWLAPECLVAAFFNRPPSTQAPTTSHYELSAIAAESLDLGVDAGGKVELHQRVH